MCTANLVFEHVLGQVRGTGCTLRVQEPFPGACTDVGFYLEEAKNGKPLVTITPGKMLLFFKLYDPWQQTLSYLGRCYAHDTNTLPGLMPFLWKKAGLPEGTALEVECNDLPAFGFKAHRYTHTHHRLYYVPSVVALHHSQPHRRLCWALTACCE